MSQDVGISEAGMGVDVDGAGGLCLVVGVDGQYNKAQTFILDTRWMLVKASRTEENRTERNSS